MSWAEPRRDVARVGDAADPGQRDSILPLGAGPFELRPRATVRRGVTAGPPSDTKTRPGDGRGIRMDTMMDGAVFVQTNAAHNEVVAFSRAADGSLSPPGSYATGGAGDDTAHLTSQGSVTLTRDRRYLLVTNVASNDVSVFALNGAMLELTKTVPTGPAPKSVTEHDGLVFVLATGDATIHGYRLVDGDLVPIDGTARALSTPDGAQVAFTPGGRAVIATERGGDRLSAFAVGRDGMLGEPRTIDSLGATPYGFAISPNGTLVVTEAYRAEKGAAAASSYRVDGHAITPVTKSIGNGRSEICWAVITSDGRFAFTTNFADGAVSRYAIDMDGELRLEDATAGLTQDGRPGLRDEDLTDDGRFLFVIDADQGQLVGWSVDDRGRLATIGSWAGVPTTVAGLAAI
jgi:6-phosphogluconolactonase